MEQKRKNWLMCFVTLVLVFGLVGSAFAADVLWDGGGSDNYWTTPENWVGDVLPDDIDDYAMISDPFVPQPLVCDGVTASAFRVIVGQNNGPCTLTVTGGSITSSGHVFTVGRSPGGEGILNLSGGDVLAAEGFIIANYLDTGTVNMSGGTLTVQTADASKWFHHFIVGDNGTGTLNMSGGVITAKNNMYISYNNMGTGIVNMTGGEINVTDTIIIVRSSTGEFHLDGGLVTAADLSMTANGSLDLTNGVMILDDDDTSAVQEYIDSGWITGYGGAGDVLLDYDVTNPGKTTLSAIPEPATLALLGLGGLLSLLRRRISR